METNHCHLRNRHNKESNCYQCEHFEKCDRINFVGNNADNFCKEKKPKLTDTFIFYPELVEDEIVEFVSHIKHE